LPVESAEPVAAEKISDFILLTGQRETGEREYLSGVYVIRKDGDTKNKNGIDR